MWMGPDLGVVAVKLKTRRRGDAAVRGDGFGYLILSLCKIVIRLSSNFFSRYVNSNNPTRRCVSLCRSTAALIDRMTN